MSWSLLLRLFLRLRTSLDRGAVARRRRLDGDQAGSASALFRLTLAPLLHQLAGQHLILASGLARFGALHIAARVGCRDLLPTRAGAVAVAAAIGAAAPDRRLRGLCGGTGEQQGEGEGLHGVSPVEGGVSGFGGLGGFGRGGWAWTLARARSIAPCTISSLACSDCSMLLKIASRCSGAGLRST